MRKNEIVIIDLGVGNIWAVENMFRYLNYRVRLSSDPVDILNAELSVLAGVGSFDGMIMALEEKGLLDCLANFKQNGSGKLVGICVGMQVLFNFSEEGSSTGLGLIPGKVKKMAPQKDDASLKLPHIGWQNVVWGENFSLRANFDFMPDWFYFAHSYHCIPEATNQISATAKYGEEFVCVVEHDRVMGFQFHPEKSHKFGFELLRTLADSANIDRVQ